MKLKFPISVIINALMVGVVIVGIIHIRKIENQNHYLEERLSFYKELDDLRGKVIDGDSTAFTQLYTKLSPDWMEERTYKYPDPDLLFYSLIMVHKYHEKESAWLVLNSLDYLDVLCEFPDSLYYPLDKYYHQMAAESYYNRHHDSLMLNIVEEQYKKTE